MYTLYVFSVFDSYNPYEKEQLRHFDLTCSFPRFPNFLFPLPSLYCGQNSGRYTGHCCQNCNRCYIFCLDRIVPVNGRFSRRSYLRRLFFTEFVNIISYDFPSVPSFSPRLLLSVLRILYWSPVLSHHILPYHK